MPNVIIIQNILGHKILILLLFTTQLTFWVLLQLFAERPVDIILSPAKVQINDINKFLHIIQYNEFIDGVRATMARR